MLVVFKKKGKKTLFLAYLQILEYLFFKHCKGILHFVEGNFSQGGEEGGFSRFWPGRST